MGEGKSRKRRSKTEKLRRRRWGKRGKVDQLTNEATGKEDKELHTRVIRKKGGLYAKLCNSVEYIKHVYKARRRRIHRAAEQSGPQLLRADALSPREK